MEQTKRSDQEDTVTTEKLQCIIKNIINELGYGYRESVYQRALAYELRTQGHTVELEVNKTILYKGHYDIGTLRLDMIIDNKIIVELKTISKLTIKEQRQIESYLKHTDLSDGYLININTTNDNYEIKSFRR